MTASTESKPKPAPRATAQPRPRSNGKVVTGRGPVASGPGADSLVADFAGADLSVTAVTLPRQFGSDDLARRLTAGGPVGAALIDCAAVQDAPASAVRTLILQLVTVRGARWIQLIEPPATWGECARELLAQWGLDGALSIVPRASLAS